jgi:hypothetical protein
MGLKRALLNEQGLARGNTHFGDQKRPFTLKIDPSMSLNDRFVPKT